MKAFHGWLALLLCAAPLAQAQTSGFALQMEIDGGGDDISNSQTHASKSDLGEGIYLAIGGFHRWSEQSRWELQGFVGYKSAMPWILRDEKDEDSNITTGVLHLVGIYRPNDKAYWGGGLVYHFNPRYYDDNPGAVDVDFDDAVGATVEAGWRWFALQYTYIKYHAVYGDFDASNYGLRFTWKFEKPLNRR